MAEKDNPRKSSIFVGGVIAAVVVLALIVTLTWYFVHFGKALWH